jgi:tRNA uridine 5-carbamoylmethylation protein Kti12
MIKNTRNYKNKGLKKGLNLAFKQGTKQHCVIQETKPQDVMIM